MLQAELGLIYGHAARLAIGFSVHLMGWLGTGVAGWITGWQAYSPMVNATFCDAGEKIAGFIFIGHPGAEIIERPRPPLDSVARRWVPPKD